MEFRYIWFGVPAWGFGVVAQGSRSEVGIRIQVESSGSEFWLGLRRTPSLGWGPELYGYAGLGTI